MPADDGGSLPCPLAPCCHKGGSLSLLPRSLIAVTTMPLIEDTGYSLRSCPGPPRLSRCSSVFNVARQRRRAIVSSKSPYTSSPLPSLIYMYLLRFFGGGRPLQNAMPHDRPSLTSLDSDEER